MPLFHNVKKNILSVFTLKNILYQLLAIALTYVIVVSDFDWIYYKFVQTLGLNNWLFPAIIIGGIIPMFGLPALYIFSKLTKKSELLHTTWALSQSAVLGWFISSTYKAFTGRVQPQMFLENALVDNSRDWNFGILKHGIFWGWPSSHTAVAFAMAFALIQLYPKNKTIIVTSLVYAFFVGIGVSTSIHWLSEFVAGAIIGSIIGIAVGKSFSQNQSNP